MTNEGRVARRQPLNINSPRETGTQPIMGHHGRVQAQHATEPAGSATPSGAADSAQHAVVNYPRTTSFRSRRGSVSDAQQRTWERLWPMLGTQARRSDDSVEALDTRIWFGRDAPVVLDIGCGSGTSTVAMAQAEPDIDVLAVEVYRRGLAQLLSAIDRKDIGNIRLIRGDAIDVLAHMLAPDSLVGVRVFFPDPWPKARHHKRRLLQPATIALIADRLRGGGVLHAATDHSDYAEQIAECGDAEPRLRRLATEAEPPISVVRPATKYETKAHHAGSAVSDMIWEKPR